MTPEPSPNWPQLIVRFRLPGDFISAVPTGSGHINDTFAVTLRTAAAATRYIFQRINANVFRDIPALMENIHRVTAHIPGGLKLTPGHDGLPYVHDDQAACWRCYDFIEGASTHDLITHPDQARAAAFSFGEFQAKLVDLPGPRLHETIPDFHHTRRRFEALKNAIAANPLGRLATIRENVEFALSRESIVDRLLDLTARGEIPERVTHNDTKINNVMLDDTTGRGVAVIDLDTVMPGLVHYDFGDMVRTATNSANEDETDLSKVGVRLEVFDALAEGYLAATGTTLTVTEIAELEFAGRLITYENGIRFLTDHLQGDVYYKTHRPNHNLDRARCQFALLRSLETNAATLRNIIADHTK